ncbi:MAG TPA: MarR family transcriptional regulator [Pseudonocardia sp.]|nr:MarR family transcriptional regulator [Pseudonocardia sp.]
MADLVTDDTTRAAGVSASGAAALVVLSASPGLSVTELGRRVGLSQPAAARMVDSLQTADLVNRRPGPGREVSVQPTPAGRHAASLLLTARGEPLDELVSVLDEGEQDTLADLLAKLLTRLHTRVGSSELLCRLCDRASCTASAPCPVGKAEREQGR